MRTKIKGRPAYPHSDVEPRSWPWPAAALLSCVLLGCLVIPASVEAEDDEIVVTGVGRAIAQADWITISVNIQSIAKEQSTAVEATENKYQAILEGLSLLGVGDADITTEEVLLKPDERIDERGKRKRSRGYHSEYKITIRYRDATHSRRILNACAKAGVRHVMRPVFHTANVDSVHKVALADAVRDARSNAETIAAAESRTLGVLVEIVSADAARGRGLDIYHHARRRLGPGGDYKLATGDRLFEVTVLARWKYEKK